MSSSTIVYGCEIIKYTPATAPLILAAMLALLVLGAVVWGWVDDDFDKREM